MVWDVVSMVFEENVIDAACASGMANADNAKISTAKTERYAKLFKLNTTWSLDT